MIKLNEISDKLNTISSLESLKIVIQIDSSQGKVVYNIHTTCLSKQFTGDGICFGNRENNLSGILTAAVARINDNVKAEFQPIIEQLKKEVKELL